MEKAILCDHCGKAIEYRDELVTVQRMGLRLRPYHKSCFTEEAQGVTGLFLSQPANGSAGRVSGILYLLAAIVCIFIGQLGIFRWFIVAFCLYEAAMPVISHSRYEKHLKQ